MRCYTGSLLLFHSPRSARLKAHTLSYSPEVARFHLRLSKNLTFSAVIETYMCQQLWIRKLLKMWAKTRGFLGISSFYSHPLGGLTFLMLLGDFIVCGQLIFSTTLWSDAATSNRLSEASYRNITSNNQYQPGRQAAKRLGRLGLEFPDGSKLGSPQSTR